MIRATGALRHPATGTLVTEVAIEHRLSSGAGHATLDVPGLTFGPEPAARRAYPPDRGRGRARERHNQRPGADRLGGRRRRSRRAATSRRPDMDFAAPFGPVSGASGTIHFNDLLGLTTPPGQTAERPVGQPRHPRRERRHPLPAAAPPAGQDRARRMAVHGRPPDPRGNRPQLRQAERQAPDVRVEGLDAQHVRRQPRLQGA